ncbi:MAG: MmcQ/YjbR family DNA-binding protein [Chitinophagaceae bacterium]
MLLVPSSSCDEEVTDGEVSRGQRSHLRQPNDRNYYMDAEYIRQYCLKKKGVTEGFPFGETTLVFKVMDKIFLLLVLDQMPARFNAKCDPDKALEWREQYPSVQPGYHMNKKLWNTVTMDGSISVTLLKTMIDDSYDLVVLSLSLKARKELSSC